MIEVINRNTSGNSGREIISFILSEKHIEQIFSGFDKAKEYSQKYFPIHLDLIKSLLSFCFLEETRHNYKSQFVNSENEESQCDKLCILFLQNVTEKIPDFIEFINEHNSNLTINTSWKESINVFGLEKLKLIEILCFLIKFKKHDFISTLLDNDIFQKIFVKIIFVYYYLAFF